MNNPVRSLWSGRPPFLLYSYIAAELLAPFFASFVLLYGIFFLVQLIPLLDVVLVLRIGIADFIRLNAYLFPHMLLYIIPMASMIGVIICFSRLANDREILAFKACGISLRQMLPPVLVVSAVIAAVTGYFSVKLIPRGEQSMKQLMFQLAKEKIDKGLKEREFTEALGDIVVYVEDIDEQQNWHGVYVSDSRGRVQPLITVARSGQLRSDVEHMQAVVVLENGTLHNVDNTLVHKNYLRQDNQVLRFKRYQLQIPLQTPGGGLGKQGRGAMTQSQLLAAAKQVGRHSKEGLSYRSTFHHRLSMPVGCFILSLIGLPLALQAGPGRRAVGIPLGLAVCVGYYSAFTLAKVLCESRILPMALGMWLPNALFLIFALYFLWRVDQERPLLPERVHVALVLRYDRYLRPVLLAVRSWGRALLVRFLGRPAQQSQGGLDAGAGLLIHANVHTRAFHFPECAQYHAPQCRIEFKDARVAREAGFHPCGFCATLLDRKRR